LHLAAKLSGPAIQPFREARATMSNSTGTLVTIGTNKGAFFFHGDKARKNWTVSGPHLPGWEVSAIHRDRGGLIFLGTTHYVYGATFRVSDDMGKTWNELSGRPQYPEASGRKVKRIWQLTDGHPSQPQSLLCGVDEAGIFVSHNRGETWQEMTGLTHPRKTGEWFPGNGGLCLHTILVDPNNPKRLWVAISAVGFFRSTDGGETWEETVGGLPAMPTGVEGTPECRCVHKVVLDPRNSNTLYMQFHGGVFRSTDAGSSWKPIENGLPGNFGFPMVISKRGELFIAPLQADEQRFMKDGKFRIYKSSDGGESWAPKSAGLPADPQFVGVLRDAMAVDPHDTPGVYVGTTMGEIWASNDSGETWMNLPGQYPRIEVVRAYAV
jgi:photosystem II stability/assembly factor-like uncharacterized protein